MLSTFLLIVTCAVASWSSPLDWHCRDDAQVDLPTGRYIGSHDAVSSTTTFYAIPYAYASRFEPSKPIDKKPGISADTLVNASTHGPACINFNLPPPFNKGFSFLLGPTPIEPQSEVCLNMDVYVPDGDHKDLPVLVFTPGGGFLVGASFVYDMKSLVGRGLATGKPFIGVSLNYRLGPLGFLNPSTWQENLNLGLLDQVEALKYVQKYIGAFGGSSEKVTISGQSAGGESTMEQFLFADDNLFRSAWIMSSPTSTSPYLSPESAYKDGLVKSYAEACGCRTQENISAAIDCLRTTSVSILVNNSAAWEGSMTSLGGNYVKHNIFDTIRAGHFPKIPVVVSTCRDEGTLSALGFHPNNTKTTSILIEQLIAGRGLKGNEAEQFLSEMLQAYPNIPALGCPFNGQDTEYGDGSQFKRMAAIATDGTWTEGWLEILETLSLKTETWGLLWEQPIPGAPKELGVTHGSDLIYYFPDLFGARSSPNSATAGAVLMHAVQDALINFVSFGNPNGGFESKESGYQWPLYSEGQLITVMNESKIAQAQMPPDRPGFEVIHKFLRPGPV